MTGTVATPLSAAFRPSPPRGMIRSTTPSCVASSASSSRPPPATSDDRALGHARLRGGLGGDRRQHGVGVRRRRRAPQHDRVARLQAQRGRVDRHVRARLVDDGDHAQRHAGLADVEAVGQPAPVDDLADGVGQRGDRRGRRRPSRGRGRHRGRGDPGARRPARSGARPPCHARWPRGSRRYAPAARRRSRPARRPSSRCPARPARARPPGAWRQDRAATDLRPCDEPWSVRAAAEASSN